MSSPLPAKLANSVRSTAPSSSNLKLARGYPDFKPEIYMLDYDTTKEARILGIKYTSAEKSTTDMLNDFGRRGW
jgi:hypothetical protein